MMDPRIRQQDQIDDCQSDLNNACYPEQSGTLSETVAYSSRGGHVVDGCWVGAVGMWCCWWWLLLVDFSVAFGRDPSFGAEVLLS